MNVLQAVKEAKKNQAERREKNKRKKGGITDKTVLYEQMRAGLMEQQTSVEEEAEIGRALTEEINTLNAQNELHQQITMETVMKAEEANMVIMRNIIRLRQVVKQYETRLIQLESIVNSKKTEMSAKKTKQSGGEMFFF